MMLGEVLTDEGDLAQAQQLLGESLRRFRELGDDYRAMMASDALAGVSRTSATSSTRDDCTRTTSVAHVTSPTVASRHGRSVSWRRYARDEGRVEDAIAMLQGVHLASSATSTTASGWRTTSAVSRARSPSPDRAETASG